jgi:predicted phosphodiesterase
MKQASISGRLAKKYLTEYPDLPTNTIARMLHKDNPEVFNGIDHARKTLRYYRLACGEANRARIGDRRFEREISHSNYNPFQLPESDEKEFEPFVIEGFKRLLVLNDIHTPYHSVEALTIALEFAAKEEIDCILLNGDIIDFHQLSHFEKDPRNRHFDQELISLNQLFESLILAFGVPIFYKLGNHEERYISYMRVKAPELLSIKLFSFENVINAEDYGITVIKDKRTVRFGKLNILHGHELKGGLIPPVNPARGVYLRTTDNTLVGHFHNQSSHSENTLSGRHISCWSNGCLCDLHPEWMPNNRWNHGFAIVDLFDEGNFSVNNYKIIKGKVY